MGVSHVVLVVKNPPANARDIKDLGSIPGSGRSPGGGHGNPTSILFFFFLIIIFFYCSGFCHTLKWNSHGFTCVPHPDPPSHLPLYPIPLGLPSAQVRALVSFIAALFIIARTWKQPRCPSADEWVRKLWYIYTMEYYSAIKKNSFESVLMRWMKLEPIIQSEVSQKDKDHYNILTHIYGI